MVDGLRAGSRFTPGFSIEKAGLRPGRQLDELGFGKVKNPLLYIACAADQ